jgi:hypothetical protein
MISRVSSEVQAPQVARVRRPDAVYTYAAALAHRNPRVGHMGIEIYDRSGAHKRDRLTSVSAPLTLLSRDS